MCQASVNTAMFLWIQLLITWIIRKTCVVQLVMVCLTSAFHCAGLFVVMMIGHKHISQTGHALCHVFKRHALRYYQILICPCRALFDSQPVLVQSHSCDPKVGIPDVKHVCQSYFNMPVLFTIFCNSFLWGLNFDIQEASYYRWHWSLLSSIPPSRYLNSAFKEATTTHLPQLITCSNLSFHTELPATCCYSHLSLWTSISRNDFVVG